MSRVKVRVRVSARFLEVCANNMQILISRPICLKKNAGCAIKRVYTNHQKCHFRCFELHGCTGSLV